MTCYKTAQAPYVGHFQFYTTPPYKHQDAAQNDYAVPSTDVLESNEAYKVKVSLPGVSKELIDIKFSENVLTVQTAKTSESNSDWEQVNKSANEDKESSAETEETQKPEETAKVDEFKPVITRIPTKPYKKSVEFGKKVNDEAITAEYENGVLTLVLAKAPKNSKVIHLA
ncbi:HSP20-like chaperone [Conidiobolus coronatus NRRL 28638]|uniref:HSP20-like chaperone n=1 Tax=Conidiobolus coronatus (strain ATCC 28846 / CBS 209.66 / NRRL 28638) TaxID=796925 RepID=A0A137P733_CONC2|nr:HSP20-like chaperone [Conidiobolus coronatus NRRL 28638]|eukprot:KXN70812.1 HSP20-like chaperone [Conidiobolus coronatus NRRL 28638]